MDVILRLGREVAMYKHIFLFSSCLCFSSCGLESNEESSVVTGPVSVIMAPGGELGGSRLRIQSSHAAYELIVKPGVRLKDVETRESNIRWQLGHTYEVRGEVVDTSQFSNTFVHEKTIVAKAISYIGPPPYDPDQALDTAIAFDDLAGVEEALARGADIHQSVGLNSTILHRAARKAGPEVVKALIDHGADVNARGYLGMTPLHVAVQSCKSLNPLKPDPTLVIAALMEQSADPTIQSDSGETPWDLANGFWGSPEAREILLDLQANVSARDIPTEDENPWDF